MADKADKDSPQDLSILNVAVVVVTVSVETIFFSNPPAASKRRSFFNGDVNMLDLPVQLLFCNKN